MNKISAIKYDLISDALQIVGDNGIIVVTFSTNELKKNLPDWFLEKDLSDYSEWELVDELENRGYDFSEQLDRSDIIELYNDLNGPSPDIEECPLNVLYEIVKKRHPHSYIDKQVMRETLLEMVDEILFLS